MKLAPRSQAWPQAQPQSFKLVVAVTAGTAPVFNSVALMAPNCGDDVDDTGGVVIPTKAPEVPGHHLEGVFVKKDGMSQKNMVDL